MKVNFIFKLAIRIDDENHNHYQYECRRSVQFFGLCIFGNKNSVMKLLYLGCD